MCPGGFHPDHKGSNLRGKYKRKTRSNKNFQEGRQKKTCRKQIINGTRTKYKASSTCWMYVGGPQDDGRETPSCTTLFFTHLSGWGWGGGSKSTREKFPGGLPGPRCTPRREEDSRGSEAEDGWQQVSGCSGVNHRTDHLRERSAMAAQIVQASSQQVCKGGKRDQERKKGGNQDESPLTPR
jgi:hypothetical protein